MKTIFKSFKFRIYPNKEQEVLLAKHFGACRFVFNHYLNKRKESYLHDKKSLNYYDNANDLTLSNRECECLSCGERHDRDFNASKNILKQGFKILSGSGTESDTKQKQVEALSLDESMKPETH